LAKFKRSNTNDSVSPPITIFRSQLRRKRTGSSEMSGPKGRARAQKKRSLRNDLKAEMILQGHPDLQFVPTGVLDKLLDPTTVGKTLEQYKPKLNTDISVLESFICSKARRIFAILAWADAEPFIEQFSVRVEENDNFYEITSLRFGHISIDDHPFNYDQWTDRNIYSFCDNDQWPFLSPVLSESQFRYEFHERTRMPFLDERFRSMKESFFSVVEEWRMHRDHIRAPKVIVRASFLF
jgi:hypothetical protein